MKTEVWQNIEYTEVNLMREHYANQKGARSYSMLSPSDVPTHFLLKRDDKTIEIHFRYMNESEKRKKITLLESAIFAEIGKASKKIYYIKADLDNLRAALDAASDKKNLIRKAAENKVKETSYSAIKEIFSKYIKEFLSLEKTGFAF